MPRVMHRTPDWLAPPRAGHRLFSAPARMSVSRVVNTDQPLRTIAAIDTEVFVAVNNELRWSDIRLLREESQLQKDGHDPGYGVLRIPGMGDILQLAVSPLGDYIAVVRSHTVHVIVRPDVELLQQRLLGPIKVTSFQLGPTAHVLESAPIVSVLWHPLGEQGRCLVTITSDAVVRLWEVNRKDRLSFDKPTTAIDLKKLANAVSAQQDLRASTYGSGHNFSPDSAELVPVGACFGGSGAEAQSPWRAMTLWIAMREGGVYALCPLLPRRWQTHPDTLEALTLSAELGGDNADTQKEWVAELAEQEPFFVGEEPFLRHVYTRPNRPGFVPRLQGPFQIDSDLLEEQGLADIMVFSVGDDRHGSDERFVPLAWPGLIVTLLTQGGHLVIALDIDGVSPAWLPLQTPHNSLSTPGRTPIFDDSRPLLVFETIYMPECPTDKGSPSLSRNPTLAHGCLVTRPTGVSLVDMTWVETLQNELADPTAPGSAFRADVFVAEAHSNVSHLVTFRNPAAHPGLPDVVREPGLPVTAIILENPGLPNLLLTATGKVPYGVHFDSADAATDPLEENFPALAAARDPYLPDPVFLAPSNMRIMLESKIPPSKRFLLRDEVRLSPWVLETLATAHRVLSAETYALGIAAGDLFARCERMLGEFEAQREALREVGLRVEQLVGEDGVGRVEGRLSEVKARQAGIVERERKLRMKLAKLRTPSLSEKEKAWKGEVGRIEGEVEKGLVRRFEGVRELAGQVKGLASEVQEEGEKEREKGGIRVPPEVRKRRMKGVMELLERETALVEGVMERFGRLKVGE
ncbi:hypothetical protein EJ06DRAFT_497359 [Trichodelitschia bisporula]|uniref:Uncharacterized protein n=1 Tax=Trichodelitschia bisporula TaxID=703511 RepID=A0A6G1HQC9_9PEZI|nr:hypothetical protein EJ06DRAFT_497359 [Trichodelitschia bisporula]